MVIFPFFFFNLFQNLIDISLCTQLNTIFSHNYSHCNFNIYPQGCQGCQKTGRTRESITCCVFAPIFSPNWTNYEKPSHKSHFWWIFLILWGFLRIVWFGQNISAKTLFWFFWHPWHPWGCVHTDLKKNRVQSSFIPDSRVWAHIVQKPYQACFRFILFLSKPNISR